MIPRPAPKAYADPREARRRKLAKRTKAQLVAMASPYTWGASPLSSWTKEEVLASILDHEFPAGR